MERVEEKGENCLDRKICESAGVHDRMGLERWLGWSPPSFIQIGPKLSKLSKSVFGVVSGWVGMLGWAKHTPRYVAYLFTITQSKLDLPTKFHPNRTKIAKVCYWGGFGVGGWGGRNVPLAARGPLAIPYADILLLPLNYTFPPNFILIAKVSYSGWFQGG